MSKKIAVMCGHGTQTNGKWDCGTTYAGYNEAALMLPITKAAVKYLRASGLTVISDADNNNNKNMIADVAWANKEKVELYCSIHCDYSKAPSGVMPLYVSDKGKKLATALNVAIKNGMPMKSRGVVKRTDLYELNMTDAPAVILETGSIKADLKILRDNPDKYGKLIAKGICNYLGIKQSDPQPTPEPQTHLYRVRKSWKDAKSQLGAYKSLENAKAECAKHKGYSVFDENGKVLYTTPTPAKTTNADKIIAKAKALAGKESSPTTAYKNALNKAYPDRKGWGEGPKLGRACDVFVGTVVRSLGFDKACPRGLTEQLTHTPNSKYFTRLVYHGVRPYDVSKTGDIIFYDKPNGHTCIRTATGIYEANNSSKKYPHFTKGFGRLEPKRNKVVIWRPKG